MACFPKLSTKTPSHTTRETSELLEACSPEEGQHIPLLPSAQLSELPGYNQFSSDAGGNWLRPLGAPPQSAVPSQRGLRHCYHHLLRRSRSRQPHPLRRMTHRDSRAPLGSWRRLQSSPPLRHSGRLPEF